MRFETTSGDGSWIVGGGGGFERVEEEELMKRREISNHSIVQDVSKGRLTQILMQEWSRELPVAVVES